MASCRQSHIEVWIELPTCKASVHSYGAYFLMSTLQLNTTIDILLGIDHNSMSSPEDLAAKPNDMSTIAPSGRAVMFKKMLAIIQRIGITCLSVFVSISIPEFSSMMAFLGSFSAFILAIVGPVAAKVIIDRRCGLFDASVMLAGAVMAIWGTRCCVCVCFMIVTKSHVSAPSTNLLLVTYILEAVAYYGRFPFQLAISLGLSVLLYILSNILYLDSG